jgi:hypothetical protein
MANGFQVNEENALDAFVYQETRALEHESTILYAVVCQHPREVDGVGSHGGFIVSSARRALDMAKNANESAPPEHRCWYVPIALNIELVEWVQLLANTTGKPGEDRTT